VAVARAELQRVLAESELFELLEAEDLGRLLDISATRAFAQGEVVFLSGQPAKQLYAVVSGRIRVVASAPDGRELVLRLFDPGDLLGEMALLDGGGRSATAIADAKSVLLVIQKRDFHDLLRRRPQIAIDLLAVLAARLRSTTEQIEDTNFRNLPPRLAKKLLELAESYGEAGPGGDGVRIRISQEELGNLVSTSRVSVNQQLKAWEREGLLRTARGTVTLLDREAIEGAAAE
jgi:CRP/FNR family cyclic AMP-dependent transcriptional regulator